MKVPLEEIHVCDFCHHQHIQYMGDVKDFDILKKKQASKCFICHQAICNDCEHHSKKETEGTLMNKLGLNICRPCIVGYRRTTDLREKVDEKLYEGLKNMKEKLDMDVVFILNEYKTCKHL